LPIVGWRWSLLGCAVAASFAGAEASAATRAHVYVLRLSGTASARWDHTGAAARDGSCTKTLRTEGIRTVRFTSRPTRVQVVDGRLLAADVRGIRGTVTLGGAETTDRRCGDGTGTSQIADCAPSTRSFTGGSVRLSSPAPGRLAFGAVRRVRLPVANCPDEVAAVRRAPAGLSPGPIRLPAKLSHPRTGSVTSRVSFRREDRFAAPEKGSVVQTIVWTLTFTRVKT
jgi:hypothetical protein